MLHVGEMQIDELYAPGSEADKMRGDMTAEEKTRAAKMLKESLPSITKAEHIQACIERLKRADAQCAISASTSAEVVEKCHWKVMPGPKGMVIGF